MSSQRTARHIVPRLVQGNTAELVDVRTLLSLHKCYLIKKKWFYWTFHKIDINPPIISFFDQLSDGSLKMIWLFVIISTFVNHHRLSYLRRFNWYFVSYSAVSPWPLLCHSLFVNYSSNLESIISYCNPEYQVINWIQGIISQNKVENDGPGCISR